MTKRKEEEGVERRVRKLSGEGRKEARSEKEVRNKCDPFFVFPLCELPCDPLLVFSLPTHPNFFQQHEKVRRSFLE